MSAREIAVKLLSDNQKLSTFINLELKNALSDTSLSTIDKAFVTALVNGVLQKQMVLDFYLSRYIKKDFSSLNITITCILRITAYQILYMDKIPVSAACNEAVNITKRLKGNFLSGFVNGVSRNIAKDKELLLSLPLTPELEFGIPLFIMDIWRESYGEQTALQIASAQNLIPKTTIVLNTVYTKKEEILASLLADGVSVCEETLQINNGCDIASTSAFINGDILIQGASSRLVCEIISPIENDRILDCCASPGGKSLNMQIIAKNKAHITSCDITSKRVALIDSSANRTNLNLDTKVIDARVFNNDFANSFDIVLCDVPCSGFGSIRKKRDIINKNLEQIVPLYDIQKNIIENCKHYVKVGGRLIYSTCTLSKFENEDIVMNFLKNNSNFSILPINLPHSSVITCKTVNNCVTIIPNGHFDGFFVAVLKREF